MTRPRAGSFGAIRAGLRFVFGRIVAVYFRQVDVAGELPAPDVGGRLFAANHVNGLVDPILVLTQAPCPISPVAKSTLWKVPGLTWLLDAADAVPIVRRRDDPTKSEGDNEAVFDRVASHLSGGGNILIFPEGTSHNEPHLLGLRSGAGRMLARAHGEGDALTFQAVALEFDARDVFRSRALVLFGPVRRVRDLVGSGDLATRITETLRDDLSELLVEGSTWEEHRLIVRVADMFADPDAPLTARNVFGRRVERAKRVLAAASPAKVAAMEDALRRYFADLEEAGVTDAWVQRSAAAGDDVALARVGHAALTLLTLPLAVAGAVLYWLPYHVPRLVTRRLGGDPDVASTYKLGIGLLVYPTWAALVVTLAFVLLPVERAVALTVLSLTGPFAALPWLDRWDRLAARGRLLVPSEERRANLGALHGRRADLLRGLETLRAEAEDAPADPAP